MNRAAQTNTPGTAPTWRPALDEYEKTLTAAIDAAALFAADLERTAPTWQNAKAVETRWLTLSGMQGCGKTMLARQLYDRCKPFNPGAASLWVGGRDVLTDRNRRPAALWMTAVEFADRCYRDRGYPEYLARDFLVVIDDLGAAQEDAGAMRWLAAAIYRLCNARLGSWTIFTTNWTLKEIADRLDPRVASRMIRDANQFLTIAAGDYALRKRNQKT